jgi:hypothetical protein
MTKRKELDVEALLDLVPFSPEGVLEAACGNTTLYVDAIRFRLKCLEEASTTKQAWEQTYAEKELTLRETLAQREAASPSKRGSGVREGYIKSLLQKDKVLVRLQEAYQHAEIYEEYSKLIVKVFEMRRDLLQTVGNMVSREYPNSRMAEQAAAQMKNERRKLRKRFPDS